MDDPALTPALRAWLEREKLEAMAEFAAGAGHEINNPVAAIVGRVQMLLPGETNADRRHQLQTIAAQALRIRDMIGDAMLFARPPAPECALCDLTEIVEREAATLRELAAARGTSIEFDLRPPAPVSVDRTQLAIVLHALVRNSFEALRSGGEVRVEVLSEPPQPEARPSPEEPRGPASLFGACLLSVTDNGPGFSDIDRRHLFDPFYSGRQAGRGLGFGLPKCWRIITLHEGTIEAVSEAGRTRFVVLLPHAGGRNAEGRK
ncbi:MAG: HAMP domain-containing histidine kinase [Planctomycetaceae bacterium]|nr:HAMP domain-containing histidine kinase [Planctomycetaceae bacterium]